MPSWPPSVAARRSAFVTGAGVPVISAARHTAKKMKGVAVASTARWPLPVLDPCADVVLAYLGGDAGVSLPLKVQ